MPENKKSLPPPDWTDPDDAPDPSSPDSSGEIAAQPVRRGRPKKETTKVPIGFRPGPPTSPRASSASGTLVTTPASNRRCERPDLGYRKTKLQQKRPKPTPSASPATSNRPRRNARSALEEFPCRGGSGSRPWFTRLCRGEKERRQALREKTARPAPMNPRQPGRQSEMNNPKPVIHDVVAMLAQQHPEEFADFCWLPPDQQIGADRADMGRSQTADCGTSETPIPPRRPRPRSPGLQAGQAAARPLILTKTSAGPRGEGESYSDVILRLAAEAA